MRYEYEKDIRHSVELELFRHGHHDREYDTEVIKELQEVYAKAKAWETLKEHFTATKQVNYEDIWKASKEGTFKKYMYLRGQKRQSNSSFRDILLNGSILALEVELEKMDKLDGTHEFSNSLNDTNMKLIEDEIKEQIINKIHGGHKQ
ncbi:MULTISPECIES: hypothetical protein [unclassified Mammaliicoccus]|uniref:hypothetical protein n=1 Tax=unclassified Mammaliicoccus TaxID=2803851 RepID=UPI001EFB848A|nr:MULTISPECIES: hypothetical protein [unclassified Mammaliicoccus]